MKDYSEKRDFPRMCIDCTARYRAEGGDNAGTALAKELSGGGLLLRIEHELPPGSRLNVEIRPGTEITPPLYLIAEVVRCNAGNDEFEIACTIVRMLSEDELPLDFP
ncbi:MAG: PilZ domain-containing protein [Gammaproteobacteria bacterium]|nr:PilZ domain-containing protein [Gammaproteobacteria bacterium]MCP5405990.1 PilZ domain-containing protein [Chromatiaceae bacterium]MCP5408584.1 PilZ domain-containing protein [Chromatiaceae bacterium]MCP5442548.1 PilZ domain-containing protein [Chromatiaceae bacterium]